MYQDENEEENQNQNFRTLFRLRLRLGTWTGLPGLSSLIAGWARTHFEALIILEYSKVTFFLVCRRLRPQICLPSEFLTAVLFSAHCPCCIFFLRIPSYVFCNKLRQIHTSCDTFPSNLAVRKESRRINALDTCSAKLSTGLDKLEHVFLKSHKL